MKARAFDLLGIRLQALSKRDLVGAVTLAVTKREQRIIGNHNLHSLYMWFSEPKMRAFYSSADYIHIDGMSLVWLGRFFGLPLGPEHRTGYMDFLPLLAEEAAWRRWRVFYLGSKPGVAEKAACALRKKHEGLQIATHHGYFDTQRSGNENRAVLDRIEACDPHILMVGMGMPRQEAWILENRRNVAAHAILCCGALMDYVAGEIPTPPRWLGPLGLEWSYRLLSEPGRLWQRYLIEPWAVFGHLAKQYWTAACAKSRAEVRHRV